MGNIALAACYDISPPQNFTKKKGRSGFSHFLCKACQNEVSPKRIKKHHQVCKGIPENIAVACDHCHRSFNLRSYEKHILECKENPENIAAVCDFCNGKFNLLAVIAHADQCLQNPRNLITQCQFCKLEAFKDCLDSHSKGCTFHPDNMKLTCKFCKQTIPSKVYDSHVEWCEQKNLEKDCPICLEEIKNNADRVFIQCLHKFHAKCIVEWSKKQKRCPQCMTEFDLENL